MIRKALLLIPVLALAASALASSAHAQFSLYGTVTLDHMTGIDTSPILQTLSPLPCTSPAASPSNCSTYKSSVDPIGFTGGVFYDLKTVGPVLLSVDARAVVANGHEGAQKAAEGAGTHIYSYLGGVRASFKTPLPAFRAYVQASAGFARSNYGVLTSALSNGPTYPSNPLYPGVPTQSNLEYHVFVGTDLKVLPFADWRVVELGYGGLRSFGTYAHTYPLYNISTGVVIHFPPRS